ncbi:MAG: DUF1080 domain-containing protein [Bacteroidales bacterium]|nr:DUF1080 domain-containing protein [Bacteroidales bacterium]
MRRVVYIMLCITAITCKHPACFSQNRKTHWISIFNGENLSGWVQLNGIAKYTVEDRTIVGRTVPGSPNSFLCTENIYGDFILEFEVKKDIILNSGVQIRSNSYPQYKSGRVFGYQVEIDNRPERSLSGGIYDEARREWLYDLDYHPEGKKAYRFGEWNKYRIEAIGPSIRVWVNGIPTANLVDDLTPAGFIGLQVHSVPDDSLCDKLEVRWKNIRIITDDPGKYSTATTIKEINTSNKLTKKEVKEGWQLLFDGQSTAGWKGAFKDAFPEKGWKVENDMMTVSASGGNESKYGGDIVTLDKYDDFELQVDFRITKGANSGIKYYVTLQEEGNKGSAFGLEFQILDDVNHPDARLGRDGNRTVGSLYDLIPARNKLVYPPGQWNHALIKSQDNHVEHWLNEVKILEYDRGSQEFRNLVKKSKYAAPEYNSHSRFGEAEEGHILLQDHGDEVSFKNIKIKISENE